MNDSDILLRPIGGFFGLGLLDVPPVVDSIWQAWMSNGRPAVMAWTARAALKWLIDLRRPGKVWLPAYTCRQLATAAPQSDLRFYPLTCELSPDIPFLQQHVRAGDLVMATNFFGWAPDEEFIASAAERPDVIWVEDRAHCLWMERQPWASWLLYSPRKLLGVPDGGILITQDRSMFPEPSWGSGDAAVAIPELMRFEDRNEIDNSTWHAAFRCREARFSAELRPMSHLTAALLRRIPLRLLVEARQRNYRFLAEQLSSYQAWQKPVEGVAPFGLPIITENAAGLSAALAAERLFCSRHWASEDLAAGAVEFRWEHSVAERLLTLPCDHRYDEAGLKRLVEAVRRLAPAPRLDRNGRPLKIDSLSARLPQCSPVATAGGIAAL